MSQFLKKNAKLFYILFLVFCGLFLILACVYITPYNTIAVKFNQKFLNGQVDAVYTGNNYLENFCKNAEINKVFVSSEGVVLGSSEKLFTYMFNLMYDFDQCMQRTNDLILRVGVISAVMVAIMMICSNHSRRKYYISNLVSGIVCPSVCIVTAAIALISNINCIGVLNANYEALNWGSLANQQAIYKSAQTWYINGDLSHFQLNSTWFIVVSVFIVLFILSAGALLAYNVWRYKETKKQLALEEAGV